MADVEKSQLIDINGLSVFKTKMDESVDAKIADVEVDEFTGATSTTAGTAGTVPAPSAGDENKYLKGDGTWGEVQGGGSAEFLGTTAEAEAAIEAGEIEVGEIVNITDDETESAITDADTLSGHEASYFATADHSHNVSDIEGAVSEDDLANYVTVGTLSNYATVGSVAGKAEKSELNSYAKSSALGNYLSKLEAQNSYATKSDFNNAATKDELGNYATKLELTNYATYTYINENCVTEEALEGYAKTSDLSAYEKKTELTTTLSNYETKEELASELEGYAEKDELEVVNGVLQAYPASGKSVRNIYVSTSAPTASDGANGDLWIVYK